MRAWLTEELPARRLGVARIMIGLAAAIRALDVWPVLRRLARDDVLNVPHYDWFPDPSVAIAVGIVAIWFVSAVSLMIGWRVTWSGTILGLTIAFTLALDQQSYSNHLYLLCLLAFLLVVADAGAALSVSGDERTIVRWPVFLLKAMLTIVYFFAAITKLNLDFLSGDVINGALDDGIVPFPDALRVRGVVAAMALATVVIELFLAVFIWGRQLQRVALSLGVCLHVSIVLFMRDTAELIVFTLQIFALYVLFLDDKE